VLGSAILGELAVTAGDDSLANSATTQLATTGFAGAVTYAVLSGTSATVTTTGLVTADAAIDGVTVVQATDSLGNTGTVTITVA